LRSVVEVWHQRTNFILAGVLYSCAAAGLGRSDRRRIGPRAVPALVAGAGIGLIGSGLFVTDYVVTLRARVLTRQRMRVRPGQPVRGRCTISAGSRSLRAYPSPAWPARPPLCGAGTTGGPATRQDRAL
jgi:hypothetical protein